MNIDEEIERLEKRLAELKDKKDIKSGDLVLIEGTQTNYVEILKVTEVWPNRLVGRAFDIKTKRSFSNCTFTNDVNIFTKIIL